MPGTSPSRPSSPATTRSTRGSPSSWFTSCRPMSSARDMRVTMMATAVDSSSEGIWATRPSPMVSSA